MNPKTLSDFMNMKLNDEGSNYVHTFTSEEFRNCIKETALATIEAVRPTVEIIESELNRHIENEFGGEYDGETFEDACKSWMGEK